MELDPQTLEPTKPKISILTVASAEKNGDQFGSVELDLSQYGKGEFKIFRKDLDQSMYPGSYIEVGLKGVPAPAPRAKMSLGSNSNDMSVASNSEQLLVLIDEFDKKKKERNKLKTDYESKR